MLQRTAKRFISMTAEERAAARVSAAMARQKNEMLNEPPPPTGLEEVKIAKRRIAKAERDERMDITRALTPVKTYMGGFTRPTDLRSSNWLSGGAYVENNKKYHAPSAAAYEPHTVFLLESRYDVVHGIGRADCHDHIIGVCREVDFPAVLQKLNSPRCPGEYQESMDNARWPFLGLKKTKRTKWWKTGENPKELVRQALDGEADGETKAYPQPEPEPPIYKGTRSERRAAAKAKRLQRKANGQVQFDLFSSDNNSYGGSHVRAFSTSSYRLEDSSSRSRSNIPASSWARPHKPSQDADDNVVPTYYVERKKQREMISERKEEEGGLMAELSAGILSEGVAAQTRVIPEKIPVEVRHPDGSVRHPSGFEPPTPETEFHPVASKTATEDDPLLTTIKVPWDAALAPDTTATSASDPSSSSSTLKGTRGFHTSAVARASEVPLTSELMQEQEDDVDLEDRAEAANIVEETTESIRELRNQYLPTLSEKPFWRPILSLTFSTRPIALTISRLSKSLPRGLPFYASIHNDDRKYGPSLDSRIRSLRLQRMTQLTIDLARIMAGERGGLIGVRFNPEERGRGIDLDKLDEKIPLEKRTVKIGVGEWYPLAAEVKDGFRMDGKAAGDYVSESLQIFGLDEFGNRTDGVEWPTPERQVKRMSHFKKVAEDALQKEYGAEEWEKILPHKRKELIHNYCREHKIDLAYEKAERSYSVMYP